MKRFLVLLMVAAIAGCGGDDASGEAGACSPSALPGDLVITEFLPNPTGTDDGREWVEIYNASSIPQCLNGMRIQVSAAKTTKNFYISSSEDILIQPGEYLLLADGDPGLPSFVFSKPLTMPNTSGTVSLQFAAQDLDVVKYGELEGSVGKAPGEGKSMALCGECLTFQCNDQAENWGQTLEASYDADGNSGSPGRANAACSCLPPEGVTLRAPKAGDLVISEILADPPGEDGVQEWFEVRVLATDAAISLAGVSISTTKGAEPVLTIPDNYCLAALPSQWFVFGRSADLEANGGVTPDYVYGSKITLKNSAGYLGLFLGQTLLTEASWESAPVGKSLQYDSDDGSWCESSVPFGTKGGMGSPGEPNYSCTQVSCMLEGVAVEALAPAAGEIRFNELLANTPGSEQADAEWIELVVEGTREVDINGLELWKADGAKASHIVTAPDARCLRFAPGDIILLARSAETAENGIPSDKIDYIYSSLTLNNSDSLLIKHKNAIIDELTYAADKDGVALARDSSTGSWCDATSPLVFGDKTAYGTPGEPNTPCGALFCLDNGVSRQVSFPAPGTATIAEVFADPAGNDKSEAEWLEIVFSADAAGKDLNGIELSINGKVVGNLGSGLSSCTPISVGPVLVAGSSDAELNGGMANVTVALPKWSLPNSSAVYSISANGVLLDEVTLPAPKSGTSIQLDSSKISPTDNDDAGAWCNGQASYNQAGDKGTPGTPNFSCSATICTNAGGTSGPAISPPAGALVITEIFANTPGSEDANKEWIEVYVPAGITTYHLQGFGLVKTMSSDPTFTFTSSVCIEMVGGQYYVLCRNIDPLSNGGISNCIKYDSLTLNNDGYLGLSYDGLVVDEVPTFGPVSDGVSWSLDPTRLSAAENDIPGNWCSTPAGQTFGTGSVGTPGEANPPCPGL